MTAVNSFAPDASALDFYFGLLSEYVQVQDPVAVEPTNDGPVIGIMSEFDGNPELDITQTPGAASSGLTRQAAKPARAGQLTVATYNVDNLSPESGRPSSPRSAARSPGTWARPTSWRCRRSRTTTGAPTTG